MRFELPPKLPDKPVRPPQPARRPLSATRGGSEDKPTKKRREPAAKETPSPTPEKGQTPPATPPFPSEKKQVNPKPPPLPTPQPSKARPTDTPDSVIVAVVLLVIAGFMVVVGMLANSSQSPSPKTGGSISYPVQTPTPEASTINGVQANPPPSQTFSPPPPSSHTPTPTPQPELPSQPSPTPPFLLPPNPSTIRQQSPTPRPTPTPTFPETNNTPQQTEACRVFRLSKGDKLSVRSGPGPRYPIVARWENGVSNIHVIGGPEDADRDIWYKVERNGVQGWVSGTYIYSYDSSVPQQSVDSEAKQPTRSSATRATKSGNIYIPQGVTMELRTSPGFNSPLRVVIPAGTYSIEVNNTSKEGGATWVQITVAGYTGWLSQNGLNRVKR